MKDVVVAAFIDELQKIAAIPNPLNKMDEAFSSSRATQAIMQRQPSLAQRNQAFMSNPENQATAQRGISQIAQDFRPTQKLDQMHNVTPVKNSPFHTPAPSDATDTSRAPEQVNKNPTSISMRNSFEGQNAGSHTFTGGNNAYKLGM